MLKVSQTSQIRISKRQDKNILLIQKQQTISLGVNSYSISQYTFPLKITANEHKIPDVFPLFDLHSYIFRQPIIIEQNHLHGCRQSTFCNDHQMTSKIKALRSKPNERDKLRTAYGVWYVTHDENDIAYAVCVSQEYPERHAFGLIDKLKEKIKQINHCEYQSEENIKAYTKKTAIELSQKYNELSKIDKVHKAQSEVKELENQLGVGIKKLITNQQTLTQMEDKAERMKSYAANFEKNSQTLERMMYWRNMKIKIIVGLMVLGLIGFIILIIVKTQKN